VTLSTKKDEEQSVSERRFRESGSFISNVRDQRHPQILKSQQYGPSSATMAMYAWTINRRRDAILIGGDMIQPPPPCSSCFVIVDEAATKEEARDDWMVNGCGGP
jgi:hypothetical protein